MTNQEIRSWYLRQVSQISALNREWADRGDSLELRARRAWKIRNESRVAARKLMQNPAEVAALRERDLRPYGRPDGPNFEDLYAEYQKRGLKNDEIFERVIERAQVTNDEVNRQGLP